VVGVELVTVVMLTLDVAAVAHGTVEVTLRDLFAAVMLTAAPLLHQELSVRLERYRSRLVSAAASLPHT